MEHGIIEIIPLLTIFIPTYNRAKYLDKNLENLFKIFSLIEREDLELIISNNCSEDETESVVKKWEQNFPIVIRYYVQKENIGLEGNLCFCLSESRGKFAMALGDDDYLSIEYIRKVLYYLETIKDIACIIPDRYGIDLDGNKISNQRFPNQRDRIYNQEHMDYKMMFEAHQISGVTFLAKECYSSYKRENGHNIYPCVFFAGYNMKRGTMIHITDCPIKVTSGAKYYFSRREDGLLTDEWQNINLLFKKNKDKYKLERYLMKRNRWMIMSCSIHPIKFARYILNSNEYSYRSKMIMLPYIFLLSIEAVVRKMVKNKGE